jgi:hypothetical protein
LRSLVDDAVADAGHEWNDGHDAGRFNRAFVYVSHYLPCYSFVPDLYQVGSITHVVSSLFILLFCSLPYQAGLINLACCFVNHYLHCLPLLQNTHSSFLSPCLQNMMGGMGGGGGGPPGAAGGNPMAAMMQQMMGGGGGGGMPQLPPGMRMPPGAPQQRRQP